MDHWHYTPLHEAASKARADVCSLLLVHGADPYQPNIHGKTALDLAPTRELKQRIVYERRGKFRPPSSISLFRENLYSDFRCV